MRRVALIAAVLGAVALSSNPVAAQDTWTVTYEGRGTYTVTTSAYMMSTTDEANPVTWSVQYHGLPRPTNEGTPTSVTQDQFLTHATASITEERRGAGYVLQSCAGRFAPGPFPVSGPVTAEMSGPFAAGEYLLKVEGPPDHGRWVASVCSPNEGPTQWSFQSPPGADPHFRYTALVNRSDLDNNERIRIILEPSAAQLRVDVTALGVPGTASSEWTGTITLDKEALAPLVPPPTTRRQFGQAPAVYPSVPPQTGNDPSTWSPIGVSTAVSGVVGLRIGLPWYTAPVDVYVGIQAPSINGVLLLQSDNSLRPMSQGVVAWKAGVAGPINEMPFGQLALAALPPGTYTFYVAVTPANQFDIQHLWATSFTR